MLAPRTGGLFILLLADIILTAKWVILMYDDVLYKGDIKV